MSVRVAGSVELGIGWIRGKVPLYPAIARRVSSRATTSEDYISPWFVWEVVGSVWEAAWDDTWDKVEEQTDQVKQHLTWANFEQE